MPLAMVNWIAVLIAAFAGFATGAVWYMTLSKPWMAAAGLTEAMIKGETGKPSPAPFLVAIIANFLIALMLHGILVHVGDPTIWRGLLSAVFIWTGFIASTLSVNYSYQLKPVRLIAIDAGHWLVNICLQGMILGVLS